jgi:hypothetical protein
MPRKKREPVILTTNITPQLSIGSTASIDGCEWCFQFDDDEPVVFATASEKNFTSEPKISFTLTNRIDSTITFFNEKSGKKLKIYTREKISN